MSKKIGVALVHGIGKQTPDFAEPIIEDLNREFKSQTGEDAEEALVIYPVFWAAVLQEKEAMFWGRMGSEPLRYKGLRRMMVDLLGDSVAYQQQPGGREVYDAVHAVFARTLNDIALEAGETAPLCIIAHSLGTVIASNYIYDLQNSARRKNLVAPEVRAEMGRRALERGETLALFYTLGSPLALWNMSYPDFGSPIEFPAPKLKNHYPDLQGEWINFYDKDDIIAFPLSNLNPVYGERVEDRQINVGNPLQSWNPLSHLPYWKDSDVLEQVVQGLVRVWREINSSST